MNVLPVAVAPGVSPAEWDSEPGRGCVGPAARRRCSPPTTRRWPSCSAGSPSAPPAPCSTESPPPASCDVTGRAPPRAPGRSHKSEQNGKTSTALSESLEQAADWFPRVLERRRLLSLPQRGVRPKRSKDVSTPRKSE